MMSCTRCYDVNAVGRQRRELVLQLGPAGIEAPAVALGAAGIIQAGSALTQGDHAQREIAEISSDRGGCPWQIASKASSSLAKARRLRDVSFSAAPRRVRASGAGAPESAQP
jgi:hypothetical protein